MGCDDREPWSCPCLRGRFGRGQRAAAAIDAMRGAARPASGAAAAGFIQAGAYLGRGLSRTGLISVEKDQCGPGASPSPAPPMARRYRACPRRPDMREARRVRAHRPQQRLPVRSTKGPGRAALFKRSLRPACRRRRATSAADRRHRRIGGARSMCDERWPPCSAAKEAPRAAPPLLRPPTAGRHEPGAGGLGGDGGADGGGAAPPPPTVTSTRRLSDGFGPGCSPAPLTWICPCGTPSCTRRLATVWARWRDRR